VGYLPNVSGPVTLVMDLRITHERLLFEKNTRLQKIVSILSAGRACLLSCQLQKPFVAQLPQREEAWLPQPGNVGRVSDTVESTWKGSALSLIAVNGITLFTLPYRHRHRHRHRHIRPGHNWLLKLVTSLSALVYQWTRLSALVYQTRCAVQFWLTSDLVYQT
jgi:hypothetical protein